MPFRVHRRHDKAASTSNTRTNTSFFERRYGYVIKKNQIIQKEKKDTEIGLELNTK